MPKVTFISHDGGESQFEAKTGETLLQVAQANGLPGIIGECGGCLSCATCHVYIDDAWLSKLDKPSADEDTMLDGTYSDRTEGSRLGCQVTMSDLLDGLIVRLPERQN